jgi:cell division protein FtsI (penicillin-binding protein 3)
VHKVGPQGYEAHKYVALFAGIAPIEQPRIVTVVVINDPKGERYGGGAIAAPLFSEMTSATLRLLNVPPSGLDAVSAATSPSPGGAT